MPDDSWHEMQTKSKHPPGVSFGIRFKTIVTSKPFMVVLTIYLVFFAELLAMTVYAQAAVRYNSEVPALPIAQKPPAVPAVTQTTPAPAQPPATPTQYPYHLSIPKLGINAPVMAKGVNAKGEMAVPTTLFETTWYNLGPAPGQRGSVVLAGHYGAPGQNGVFRNLLKLSAGDVVQVKDQNGKIYTYQVYKIQNVGEKNAPLQEIFNKRDGAYLNLITCFGTWNQDLLKYNQRTIIFTKLVPN